MINVIVNERAKLNAINFQVERTFNKKIEFLKTNPRHPSLDYKPLTGGQGLWRFRVTIKYWGITMKLQANTIVVTDVIVHL